MSYNEKDVNTIVNSTYTIPNMDTNRVKIDSELDQHVVKLLAVILSSDGRKVWIPSLSLRFTPPSKRNVL